jgi:hypothetical protein
MRAQVFKAGPRLQHRPRPLGEKIEAISGLFVHSHFPCATRIGLTPGIAHQSPVSTLDGTWRWQPPSVLFAGRHWPQGQPRYGKDVHSPVADHLRSKAHAHRKSSLRQASAQHRHPQTTVLPASLPPRGVVGGYGNASILVCGTKSPAAIDYGVLGCLLLRHRLRLRLGLLLWCEGLGDLAAGQGLAVLEAPELDLEHGVRRLVQVRPQPEVTLLGKSQSTSNRLVWAMGGGIVFFSSHYHHHHHHHHHHHPEHTSRYMRM